MKKNIFVLFGALVFLMTPHFSEAQIWKNLGKKVEKKIEQQADRRLERKIDKTIDKGFDKIEDAAETKPKKKESNKTDKKENDSKVSDKKADNSSETDFSKIFESLGNMEEGEDGEAFDPSSILKAFGMGDSPAPEAKYTFMLTVDYEIKSDGNEEDMNMTLSLSDKGYLGMSTPMSKEAFVIMDNGTTHTFMIEQKTVMSMNMDGMVGLIEDKIEEEEIDDDVSIKKIGSETLLGYRCDIYEFESSDAISRISIATQLPIKDFFTNFASMNKNAKMPKNAPTPGLPLKIVSIDKDTKEVFQMVATKADKKETVFDTSEYKSMMGF